MGIKSATEVGIAYIGYHDQIIAAKQTVDRVAARASSTEGSLFWLLVQKALLTYMSCGNVWAAKFAETSPGILFLVPPPPTTETIDILTEAGQLLLQNHPQLSQIVQKGLPFGGSLLGGSLRIDDVVQALWAEASETIEECKSNIQR